MTNDNELSLWKIPETWIQTSLANIGHGKNSIVDGPFGSNLKVKDYIDDHINGVPVLTTKNLGGDYSPQSVRYISKEKYEELKRSEVKPGDILVAKIGSIGKLGVYPQGQKRAIIPANLLKFTVTERVCFQFVYYYLGFSGFQKFIKNISTATAQPAFNVTKFRKLPIPIPPIGEQERIVAKIEELSSELDAGIAALQTAESQLKTYRQSLLKHAFEGKLTAEWRVQNEDKLETAETLLQRIKAEREARYTAELDAWKAEVKSWEANGKPGKKPRKPHPPKELPPLTEKETAELPELPDGWAWVLMNEINLESVLGKMLDKKKNKGEFKPYLRNLNVRWGNFDLDDLLEMRFESHEDGRYGLQEGDLVICEGGEPGRCAVWLGKFANEMRIQKALHRVRFTNEISPFFIQMYFELCASSKRLEKYFTGTTIKHLTGQGLAKVPVAICSRKEQYEIISELDERISIIDQLEKDITNALQQAEALRQSILKKAFAGQLVPQDPNDEPAAALLARIRAENHR